MAQDLEEGILDQVARDAEGGEMRQEGQDGVERFRLQAAVCAGDAESLQAVRELRAAEQTAQGADGEVGAVFEREAGEGWGPGEGRDRDRVEAPAELEARESRWPGDREAGGFALAGGEDGGVWEAQGGEFAVAAESAFEVREGDGVPDE